MPKNKKLISKKLEQLAKLLDEIEEARCLNSDDAETWDADLLYDLEENCQKIIKLLKDEVDKKQKDEVGQPLILEEGLCSLMDDYFEEEDD
ncbi:MAG: hypothetical protein I3274_02625 [Candidatus Moeniiplasma glomeromycotorum]|nr:hypothetical protein [Candidatus Moeniiplasma glomeromycotorum]MCE8167499.1 hypothetical protein [Candidatus Moeniiplasma glomeromycotorum]